MLLMTLVFTDGCDNIRPSRKRRVRFNSEPCMKSLKNYAYDNFKCNHILPDGFETNRKDVWADYLNDTDLCGKTSKTGKQSFLHEIDTFRMNEICNGRGRRVKINLCISEEEFRVYMVESTLRNGVCDIISLKNDQYHVIVACDVIHNECRPVHYQTQTKTKPNKRRLICKPPSGSHGDFMLF